VCLVAMLIRKGLLMADLLTLIDGASNCFISLQLNSKKPIATDWPNNGLTFEEACYPNANVGILLGETSGLLDVDLDCTEAVALADIILPKPHAVFGRNAPDSCHYLYSCVSSGKRVAFNASGSKSCIVELRGDGAQTMIPPSMHPSGSKLRVTQVNASEEPVQYSDLLRSVALLAASAELMQNWHEGKRHYLALGFAGVCLKAKLLPNHILHIIQRICKITGDMEEQDRLNAIRTTAGKPNETIAGFSQLNDVLGYDAAKRICDRIAQYAEIETETALMISPSKQADILELGQFADRANVTEAKMGIQFAEWLKHKALFAVEANQWMIWNGRYWEADQSKKIRSHAFAYVQDVKSALIDRGSVNDARNLSSYESVNRLQNITSFASTLLSVSASLFDVDQMILATGSDWVNLESGKAYTPDPNILVSKATQVSHCEHAKCPRFEQFVDDIFEGNTELISFVRRAVGYSLTGSTAEQCMFIMIGDGANGKSTFINVVNHLLGTYGTTAAAQTLVAQGGTSIGDDLVDLAGARLITVSETEEGQSLAEAKIKQMTGGDTLKGRPLYGSYVEFQIIGKLWLATNSLPHINNSDHGIWRRIMAIPFNRTFSAAEQDKTLQSKLMTELPGILNWAIQGCLEWQQEGLNPPSIVKEQVAEYRTSMDSISQFLRDECKIGSDFSYLASQFYSAYRNWCIAVGKKPKNQTAFKRALEATNGVYQKRISRGNCWFGIQPCFGV